jgi:hypothetical protein
MYFWNKYKYWKAMRYLKNLNKKHPPFDPKNWIAPSFREGVK